LHGDDGKNDWVNGVFCGCGLEISVVLGAGRAYAAVELVEGYVEDVGEGEEGRCPAVSRDAGV
jgi:hypothetical protein